MSTKLIVFALLMMLAFGAMESSDLCLEKNGSDCLHCKSDKNDYGENVDTDSGKDQTHGLRKETNWKCQDFVNSSDEKKDSCDQTTPTPNCEVYDDYGVCILCQCDHGLFFQEASGEGEEQVEGKWTCIENTFRTRYCHKYNNQKECIECKQTKIDPRFTGLYTVNSEYGLDYGLLKRDNQVFCINNESKVAAELQEALPKYKESANNHQTAKCKEYQPNNAMNDVQCISCYNPEFFDLKGNKREAIVQTGYDEKNFLYWISEMKQAQTEATFAARSCVGYPTQYVTNPEYLKTVNGSTRAITCITGYTEKAVYNTKGTLLAGLTSCVVDTKIPKCDKLQFKYDYMTFKQKRQWFLIVDKCKECESSDYVISSDGQTCYLKSSNTKYQNCVEATNSGCKKCVANQYPFQGACKNTFAPNPDVSNCKEYNVKTAAAANTYTVDCTICNFGYVLSKNVATNQNNQVTCKKYNTADVKVDKYSTLDFTKMGKPGCAQVKSDTQECTDLVEKNGFDAQGKCPRTLVPNIRQLCSRYNGANTIEGCNEYSVNEGDDVRCQTCENNHYLNSSRTRCIPKQAAGGYISNCEYADGNWCRKCKNNYILTNENTCVSTPEYYKKQINTTDNTLEANQKGYFCQVAEYTGNDGSRKLNNCKICQIGYKKAVVGDSDCETKQCCVRADNSADLNEPFLDITTKVDSDDEQTLNHLSLTLDCPTTKSSGYVYNNANNIYILKCLKTLPNCRYYREENIERCFECELGYYVTDSGKCKSTSGNLGQNINGELVAVNTVVSGCKLYSLSGEFCIECDGTKLLQHENKTQQCVDTCSTDYSPRYLAVSYSKICVKDTDLDDTNCSSGIASQPAVTNHIYELYVESDRYRYICASCKMEAGDTSTSGTANFFMDIEGTKTCIPFSDPKFRKNPDNTGYYTTNALEDTNMRYTRIWTGTGSTNKPTPNTSYHDSDYLQYTCNIIADPTTPAASERFFKVGYTKNSKCEKVTDADNCYSYETSNGDDIPQCDICYAGYYLNKETRKCESVFARPFQTRGYTAIAGGSQATAIINCVYEKYKKSSGYGLAFECARCDNGYILKADKTACYSSPHPACIRASAANTCTQCQYPYILKSGSCTLSTPDCREYTSGVCTKCDFGYELVDEKCLKLAVDCDAMDWDKSRYGDVTQIDYCKTCFATATVSGNALSAKEGVFGDRVGKYCKFGCGKFTRSFGANTNSFYNWSCCGGQCDKTQYYEVSPAKCFRAKQVDKCAEYDQSSQKCIKCTSTASEYYLLGTDSTKLCEKKCNKPNAGVQECAEFDNSSVADATCKCTKCKDPKSYLNEAGNCVANDECVKTISATQCETCDRLNRFLNSSQQCVDRTNNTCKLKLTNSSETANNAENYDVNSDSCIKCNIGYKLKNGQCVIPISTDNDYNCYIWNSDYSKCQVCNFEGQGYGLVISTNKCRQNPAGDQLKGCKAYEERSTGNFICVDCFTRDVYKYLSPANTDRYIDHDEHQCRDQNFCLVGFYQDSNHYCRSCMKTDSDDVQIFYTKENQLAQCKKYNSGDATHVKNCRRYKDFDGGSKQCISCHKGFHSDYDASDSTSGKRCISDDSPCSLPACKNYKKFTTHEYLKCDNCFNSWKFYTAREVASFNKYNKNSYNGYCDIVQAYSPDQILPTDEHVWAGVDGGVIGDEVPDDDDDDDDDDDTGFDERQEYEDPVVFGANLSFAVETVCVIVLASLAIFL